MRLKNIINESFRESVIPAMEIREVLRQEYYLKKFRENRKNPGAVILDLYEKRKLREYCVKTENQRKRYTKQQLRIYREKPSQVVS